MHFLVAQGIAQAVPVLHHLCSANELYEPLGRALVDTCLGILGGNGLARFEVGLVRRPVGVYIMLSCEAVKRGCDARRTYKKEGYNLRGSS